MSSTRTNTPQGETTTEEVGYCKPSNKTQWKKGQSGNPAGKKKGSKSVKTKFLAVASKPITVVDANGMKKKQTLLQTFFDELYKAGLTGNAPMQAQVFTLMQKFSASDSEEVTGKPEVFKQDGEAYLRFWLSDESSATIQYLKTTIPALLKQVEETEAELP